MKPENTPPKVSGRLLGTLDLLFLLVFIPVSGMCVAWLMPVLKRETEFLSGFIFIGIIAVAMTLAGLAGIIGLFSKIQVSEFGIRYRFIRTHSIDWESITELRFIGVSVKTGFSQKIFIRTRNKKIHFIPLASDTLIGYFSGIGNYKEHGE